jgi:hypothetical protein
LVWRMEYVEGWGEVRWGGVKGGLGKEKGEVVAGTKHQDEWKGAFVVVIHFLIRVPGEWQCH